MIIVLLGAPGVGKGSYAKLLQDYMKVPHISTGDILRHAIEEKSELGERVKKYVSSGDLVPDEIMLEVVKERISKPDAKDGFILDGFPRTIPQAEGLKKLLASMGRKIDFIVNMVLDEETIVKRLSARRQCPSCGAIYNMLSNPPKDNENCDICGTKVIVRPDDEPETVRFRLKVYEEKTKPLIEYYQKEPGYITFDTSSPLEEGVKRLLKLLTG